VGLNDGVGAEAAEFVGDFEGQNGDEPVDARDALLLPAAPIMPATAVP
jgi:hypothetical protein